MKLTKDHLIEGEIVEKGTYITIKENDYWGAGVSGEKGFKRDVRSGNRFYKDLTKYVDFVEVIDGKGSIVTKLPVTTFEDTLRQLGLDEYYTNSSLMFDYKDYNPRHIQINEKGNYDDFLYRIIPSE